MTATTERKQLKKLTIEITDEKLLAEAYPEVMKSVMIYQPDRQALYPIVKALYDINRQIPGVRAFYASEEIGIITETALPASEGELEVVSVEKVVPAPSKAKGAA